MLAERRRLALIGTQRREAALCLQDHWVCSRRKGRGGLRVGSKEKAGFTRGWSGDEEEGRGRWPGVKGRAGSGADCGLSKMMMKHLKESDMTSGSRAKSQRSVAGL